MRKITVMAAAAALIGGVSVATAADLGVRSSLKDEPLPVGISWGGLYVGGSVGLGAGTMEQGLTYSDLNTNSASANADSDLNGAIYGGHLGYNWQRGHLVFGLEAGINGTSLDKEASVAVNTANFGGSLDAKEEINWYATTVGRLGYATGQTLFYGFGGIAWGNVNTTITGNATVGNNPYGLDLKHDETQAGWTAGIGLEYAFDNRFSVRVEYSHVDLGSDTKNCFGLNGVKVDHTQSADFDAVKIGANYKFGSVELLK